MSYFLSLCQFYSLVDVADDCRTFQALQHWVVLDVRLPLLAVGGVAVRLDGAVLEVDDHAGAGTNRVETDLELLGLFFICYQLVIVNDGAGDFSHHLEGHVEDILVQLGDTASAGHIITRGDHRHVPRPFLQISISDLASTAQRHQTYVRELQTDPV